MMLRLTFLLLLLACAATGARAENTPLPPRKTGDLSSLQQQLQQEERNKASIANRLKETESSLAATKKDLVKTATAVQAQEKILRALEEDIARNQTSIAAMEEKLRADYGAVSSLILTLTRLRRAPPEAMIVRPGAPLETAQSAMLLKSMLATVDARAAALSADLDLLAAARRQLDADRENAARARAAAEAKYADIAVLAKKRETQFRSLNHDYRTAAASVEKLARDAKNMQDFMERLQKEEPRETAAPAEKKTFKFLSGKTGPAQPPVSGPVTIAFGDKDNIGAESKGVTIEGQPRGLVICPMKGTVRFSGNFKNYGPVVIIEHTGGYHSLIIGMDKITVSTGQPLDAGEPVGRLAPASSRGGPPALYYELRYKGQPVDPARKFTELKS